MTPPDGPRQLGGKGGGDETSCRAGERECGEGMGEWGNMVLLQFVLLVVMVVLLGVIVVQVVVVRVVMAHNVNLGEKMLLLLWLLL